MSLGNASDYLSYASDGMHNSRTSLEPLCKVGLAAWDHHPLMSNTYARCRDRLEMTVDK